MADFIVEVVEDLDLEPAIIEVGTQGPPGIPGIAIGGMLERGVEFDFTDHMSLIATVPANCIIKSAQISYTEEFDDPYTVITIGTSADHAALVKDEDTKPTFSDEFEVDIADVRISVPTDVYVYISTTGMQGAGRASIIFAMKE